VTSNQAGTPGLWPRRSALKAAVTLGVSSLVLPSLNACTPEDRPDDLKVAGGEPGGFYLEFSTLFAESLRRHGVADDAAPMITGGSLENIERLLAGEATLAVALADAAVEKASGAAGRIVALGKVYENYVHCIVRRDSSFQTLTDLAGTTTAIGAAGSGTSFTAHRIIQAAGLGPSSGNAIQELQLGLNDGLAALRDGSVEALLWSGGVPTAAIAAANNELGLRFLDLSPVIHTLRTNHGAFYDRVLIPENSYEGTPAVGTVGVANLLLCRRDLDDRTVTRTVELLVNHAQELIPQSSLGVQFLSRETLVNTAGLPLHPAAAAAYRVLHG
jgi:TRAP transporter TAXI family solute receptor